jgi:hypothetical protein
MMKKLKKELFLNAAESSESPQSVGPVQQGKKGSSALACHTNSKK